MSKQDKESKRKPYPSDVKDEDWAKISHHFVHHRKAGRQPTDPREKLNALLYLTRTGIAWEYLPHDFPPKSTVFDFYSELCASGLIETMERDLAAKFREKLGRESTPSHGLIDSQSVKSGCGGEELGLDPHKKVHGRKRHMLIDTLGIILIVLVTAANVHDKTAAELMLRPKALESIPRLESVSVDSAYRELKLKTRAGDSIRVDVVEKLAGQKGFVPLPVRWRIERTNGWLMQWRRLTRDYERTVAHSRGMVFVAMTGILLRWSRDSYDAPWLASARSLAASAKSG